jgi:hypothetical protein
MALYVRVVADLGPKIRLAVILKKLSPGSPTVYGGRPSIAMNWVPETPVAPELPEIPVAPSGPEFPVKPVCPAGPVAPIRLLTGAAPPIT